MSGQPPALHFMCLRKSEAKDEHTGISDGAKLDKKSLLVLFRFRGGGQRWVGSLIPQEMAHLLREGCHHHQSGKATGRWFICNFILTFTDWDQIVFNLFFGMTKVVLLSLRRNYRHVFQAFCSDCVWRDGSFWHPLEVQAARIDDSMAVV